MKRIAILASGSGSNAQKIIEYFQGNVGIEVSIILTNNPDAFVIERADNFEVPAVIITKNDFYDTDKTLEQLKKININLIVLAGFLWLIPPKFMGSFPNQIINIHPALLPKYGGKGMYGMNVHTSVHRNRDEESGMTIHYVNENYDEGKIIYQAKCKIDPADTPETIFYKVRNLEHLHYPKIIEKILIG